MKKKFLYLFIGAVLLIFILGGHMKQKLDNTLSLESVNQILEAVENNVNVWSLLEKYDHQDIGSGNYIYQFELKEGGYLYLVGSSLKERPSRIYFIDKDNNYKDIYAIE